MAIYPVIIINYFPNFALMQQRHLRFAYTLLSIFLLIDPIVLSAADNTDSISAPKKGFIGRLIHYFDQSNKRALTTRPNFTPLGGPHYSSEVGLGLGLVIAGDYSTCPSDSLLPASNISIKGDIATKGYYSVGIDGVHVFPNNSRRINYSLKFQSFSTYFWGIGYEWANNNANKTKYNLFDVTLNGDYEWRLARGLYLGPTIELSYTKAAEIADNTPWQGQPSHYFSTAAGGHIQYDLRDNLTYPHSGVLFELTQLFAPRFLGNRNLNFSSTEVAINVYTPLWKDAVLASHLHSEWTYGHTPWGKLPFLGGGAMRGYYEGRYRDKCASDIVFELRQHLYRRFGFAIWGGVGSIYNKFSDIHFDRLLPEVGIGYRWEFKKNANVRIDVGLGKHSWGFTFGLNEAF